MARKIPVAIIGSGNIGTDLLVKILRTSSLLEVSAMAGIDPHSDGLAFAARHGVAVTHEGIDGLARLPELERARIVLDASSAGAHARHDAVCGGAGKQIIDLTPAAIGPYVVPVVNGSAHLDAPNINMVTCGGQATIPIVAAVSAVADVLYAEIVASIASRSAGPGTRANIDEFTQTTARALEVVGGARRGKAIIVLNPAEPPLIMRDTVLMLSRGADERVIEERVGEMVAAVARYVPGYRLKQRIQFEHYDRDTPLGIPGYGVFEGLKSIVMLEIEGAGHYLPPYAGNLDIMTSAALATAEQVARRISKSA